MSIKWLVVWLLGFFVLSIVTGYLFITLKKEGKKTNLPSQEAGFNYKTDPVSAIVFTKTKNEDNKEALEITFTEPTDSPNYNKHIFATTNCSKALSKLVFLRPERSDGDPKKEEVVKTGVDVYQSAQRDDTIDAFCQDEYCFEIGGVCTLKRYVYGEK